MGVLYYIILQHSFRSSSYLDFWKDKTGKYPFWALAVQICTTVEYIRFIMAISTTKHVRNGYLKNIVISKITNRKKITPIMCNFGHRKL